MLKLHTLRSGILIFCLLWGLISLFPHLCMAGNPFHGARQAGMAAAFAAIADDPSAIVMNPAGLTQVQKNILYSGTTAISSSTTYQDPSGLEQKTEWQPYFPPHLYAVSKFGCQHMSFGLGIYSLFGVGGLKWSGSGLTRFVSLENYIATMAVNPTVAWQINPDLSLGMGIYYLYSKLKANNKTDQTMLGAAEGRFDIEADGGGWGGNVGILYHVTPTFSIGAGYRSPIKIENSGTATLSRIAPTLQADFGGNRYHTPLRTTANFPEIVNVGVAYRANTKLTIGAEIEWVGWSRFRNSNLDFQKEVPSVGFIDLPVPFNWNDTWLYKIGVEYKINANYALRTGYAFIESRVPAETMSPSVPDTDSQSFTLGIGWQGDRYSLDAFYMIQFFEKITVNNDILNGSYDSFAHGLGLSLGYVF